MAELTLKRPQWGKGRIWAALVANGRRYSPATVGRILGAVRARCPICKGRGGAHEELLHLLQHDFEANQELKRLHDLIDGNVIIKMN